MNVIFGYKVFKLAKKRCFYPCTKICVDRCYLEKSISEIKRHETCVFFIIFDLKNIYPLFSAQQDDIISDSQNGAVSFQRGSDCVEASWRVAIILTKVFNTLDPH